MKLKVFILPAILIGFVLAFSLASRANAAESWAYRYTFTTSGLKGPTVGNVFRNHNPEPAVSDAVETVLSAVSSAQDGEEEVDLAASLDCSTE
jgi:hypothetical protein